MQTCLDKRLFNESPEVIHRLVVFCILSRHLSLIHLRIVHQELLQHILVESTGLRVTERCLLQHRMCTGIDNSLKLCLRDSQAQLFSFVLNQFIVYVCSPYFVFDLVCLLITQSVHAAGEFHYFRIFLYQCLKILSGNCFPVHFTYIL